MASEEVKYGCEHSLLTKNPLGQGRSRQMFWVFFCLARFYAGIILRGNTEDDKIVQSEFLVSK